MGNVQVQADDLDAVVNWALSATYPDDIADALDRLANAVAVDSEPEPSDRDAVLLGFGGTYEGVDEFDFDGNERDVWSFPKG